MAQEILLKIKALGFGDAEGKVGNLKKVLKDMKNELMRLDEGSARFKQLSAAAAELEDHIGDVNQKVKALSSDTKRLDALVGAGSAIAGAFQTASGAMALFGSNSEEVEKAIKNVIAVQGILNGVQQVSQFLTTKGIIQDALYSAGKYALTAATKVATAAQWLWNAAVTANPIGIIIVGVTALAAGIYKLAKGIKDGTITIQDLTKAMWRIIIPLTLLGDLYNYLTTAAEDNATALEKASQANTDAYNKAVSELKERRRLEQESFEEKQTQFDLNIARLQAEGKSTDELTRKKLQAIIEEKKAALQLNIDLINALVKRYEVEAALRGKSLDEYLKSIGINKDQTQKVIEDQLQDQKDAIYSAETDLIAFNNKSNQKKIDDNAQKNKQLLEQEAEYYRQLKEQQNQYLLELEAAENEYYEKQLSDRDRELRETEEKYFDLIERGKQYGVDTSILEEARLFELAEINRKFDEEEQAALDAEFDEMEKRIDEENKMREEKEREIQQTKFNIAKNFTKASIDLAQTVFTLTNALGKQDEAAKLKRAKRQFEINKALSIADATISTINGVVNALSEKSILPAPLSTVARIANAATVAAAGAANIAKIASQKFDGGSVSPETISSAGGAAEGVGATTPNINAIPAGSTLLNQPPQKVVVVESDITKTQKKVSVIESMATVG